MKSVSILPHIYVSLIVCFFLHTIAIQSHGFEEGTNVRTCENTWYGSIRAVAKFVVNRKKRCVASYDTTTQHHVQHVTVPLEEMENNWHRCYPFLQDEREEWDELTYVYHEYEYGDSDHLHQRSNALEDIGVHGATYTQDTYVVTDDVVQILRTYGHESAEYTTLYGNQFQHVLHQECIALLKRTSIVPVTSIVHAHKEALVNCIDAARAFNHEGFVHKASVISDFCWAFLDYGSAVVEGAALGLIGAVVDMAMRPVSTAACIVAGEWVFAYQLAKVTYTIADLGITYCIDPSKAHKKWDEITKPFDEIIDGLDAGAISCRDALKAGVAFGAGWRAHGKLLGGLGKLYRGIKTRVIEFAKNNPLMTPEEYMQTSDGNLLKASYKMMQSDKQKSKNIPGGNNQSSLEGAAGKISKAEIARDVAKKTKKEIETIAGETAQVSGSNVPPQEANGVGVYHDVAYHHGKSSGLKSPAPVNGQQALNNSIEVQTETTTRRIAVEGDTFVVLDQTSAANAHSPAKFHGHVREWGQLGDKMKAALIKIGWVNAKGKILK